VRSHSDPTPTPRHPQPAPPPSRHLPQVPPRLSAAAPSSPYLAYLHKIALLLEARHEKQVQPGSWVELEGVGYKRRKLDCRADDSTSWGSTATLSHPDLRANLNARIHVHQDQVTHMHQRSEYQKHSVKRKESIKQLLHDRMSQLNNRSSS
jgi:hypothetical protein